jgi:hypothetical protein
MVAVLDELELARPQPSEAVEDGEFVDFGYRPVFKEHTNRKGVPFGRKSMEKIAARCNGRIKDSGDFCPIGIRHTSDDGAFDPEIIGMMGPFRAQKMPGPNGKWAVYGRERIYKEDAAKRRKYPRLSVEYWAETDDPDGGYFDPISLLGAETPELDLGVHYSADPSNPNRQLMRYQRVIRYEAASPGGSNTYAPGTDERPNRYEAGGTLSQADIQQIIAALAPTIKQAVSEEMASLRPVGDDPEGLLSTEDDAEPMADPESLDAVFGDDSIDPEAPGDDDSDLDDPTDTDDDDSVIDESGDEPSAEIDDMIADAKPSKKKKPAQYSKLSGEPDPVEEPTMATEAEVARYQKERDDYKKKVGDLTIENQELRAKYQKASESNTALEERVMALETGKRKAERYSKLGDLQSKGFTFDLDDEIKDCEEMTDSQFDRHCDRIVAKYQRVPTGLAANGVKLAGPARTGADSERDAKKRDRYSKLAMESVQASRRNPDKAAHLDYASELKRLLAEDPEKLSVA